MADSVITKQELIDAQKDAQTLEEVINGEPGKLVETRLGRKVYTLASVPQINTMTREEVSATVAPKANKADMDAALDLKASKTEVDSALSLKAPQATTYTKSEVDTAFAAYVGGRKGYTTLALAQAAQATLPANTVVEVTNDPTSSNNGTYQWNGTTLTKSAYDPLTHAKAEMNANANFNPVKIGNVSLDTLTSAGTYLATDTPSATTENNYPVAGLGGIIYVAKASNSSYVFQEFKATNGVEYWRSFNGTVWSQWKLKVDLSKYQDLNTSFKDGGLLVANQNLNDITQSGRYLLSDGTAISTTTLNYPKNGISGALEVIKNAATSTTLQRFTEWNANGPILHTRMLRSTWSLWSSVDLSSAQKDNGLITDTENLNAKISSGFYQRTNSPPSADWQTLNYPVRAAGVLLNYNSASTTSVIQRYITNTGIEYQRLRAGSADSTWGVWTRITLDTVNYAKVVGLFDATTDADTLKTEFAFYVVNALFDIATSKLPLRTIGILKVHKGSTSSFCVQEFIAAGSGITYSRFWNGLVWSEWITPSQNSSGFIDDLIDFSKTENLLIWHKKGSGNNYIRHRFLRTIDAAKNLDSWGMSTCSEVASDKTTTVKTLTTNGVWEVAIRDAENASDHSGGTHGDELKNLSYFLVDGIYKPENFTGNFKAKEVQHVQESTIFVEASSGIICTRETTWTFTKDKCNAKTRLKFGLRGLDTAWLGMLPIYRKTNQDGTGDQVTDTEIRSQDNLVIDVSEAGFEMRNLPITDGQSILLCGQTSGISAKVHVNKIDVPSEQHAFIQNNLLYNKIYVGGKAPTGTYQTTDGEEWFIDIDFIVTTVN